MKWFVPVAVAFAALAIGAPVMIAPAGAQSKYDICSAYARDTMTAFHSSTMVPVPRRIRGQTEPRGPHFANSYFSSTSDKARATKQTRGSIEFYMQQCMRNSRRIMSGEPLVQ